MPESVLKRVENANPETEHLFGRFRTVVRSNPAVMRVAHGLWPQKTARELALRTGQSVRAAEYQLAGEREMGLEAFVALLRSPEGFAFLSAVMTAVPPAARPTWWSQLSRSAQRAELRRRQKQLAAEIEALEREEQLALGLGFERPAVVGEGGE